MRLKLWKDWHSLWNRMIYWQRGIFSTNSGAKFSQWVKLMQFFWQQMVPHLSIMMTIGGWRLNGRDIICTSFGVLMCWAFLKTLWGHKGHFLWLSAGKSLNEAQVLTRHNFLKKCDLVDFNIQFWNSFLFQKPTMGRLPITSKRFQTFYLQLTCIHWPHKKTVPIQ